MSRHTDAVDQVPKNSTQSTRCTPLPRAALGGPTGPRAKVTPWPPAPEPSNQPCDYKPTVRLGTGAGRGKSDRAVRKSL